MRLIVCTYNDYESNGGLHDAVSDDAGNIMVFQDEKSCVSFAEHHGYSIDNLDVWDMDTLGLISHWGCKRIWNESHALDSFTFIKK